jgi:LysR family transcriptional regulator, nod-box dependent transcriptional activator
MRFQGLDLNLLLALDRLFKDRSVSAAAKNLYLSQSALSHALNRLREYFGDELLIPAGRRLVLSPLAQTLVIPLREALRQIEAVVSHTPQFDPASSQRHFMILASDYSITVCLAAALRQVRRLAPRITVEIAYPDDPIARLEGGDVERSSASGCKRLRTFQSDSLISRGIFSSHVPCAGRATRM